MAEVAHDESVIESGAACGKCRLVGEERRLEVLDCKGTHLPAVGLKPNAIEPAPFAGDGVADAAALEETGRLSQRMPAIAQPPCSFGRYGGGKKRLITSASTRKFTS